MERRDRRAIEFAYERQRHAGFVGRADLLARLDPQLIEDTAQRWVVVTGGPGIGKSAVLAAWLARREAASDIVPHHFIRRGWSHWDDPEALVGSLVAQLEARFPDLREPEADARLALAARLAAALLRVSERALVPRGERLVLLIDGLDEYAPRPGSPPGVPLAAFLPYALPPGVSVLCASRPRHPYVDSLATRGVQVQIDLDDAPSFADDNAATVRAFWQQAAPALGLDAPFVAQAVERGGGNLQHAVMLRQQLAGLPPEQRRVEDIPRGLEALIAGAWERIAIEPLVVDGLGILCAARDALTLDELGRVVGWTPSRSAGRSCAGHASCSSRPGVPARGTRAAHRNPARRPGVRVPAAPRLDPRACRRSHRHRRARGASPRAGAAAGHVASASGCRRPAIRAAPRAAAPGVAMLRHRGLLGSSAGSSRRRAAVVLVLRRNSAGCPRSRTTPM